MPATQRCDAAALKAQYERLAAEPSPEARAEAAASVARQFSDGGLSDQERRIAVAILEALARDVERQVRGALAEHVKHCPFLPRPIARTLAEDVASVALPIIAYSKVLDDEDLLAVVRSGAEVKQLAVAGRETLGPRVSEALVETGNERVVSALLSNRGAEIPTRSYFKIMVDFRNREDIHALLVERPLLPLAVSERLINLVSTALRARLILCHELPRELADELMRHGREKALTSVLATDPGTAEVERLVAGLKARQALTPTLVLRTLCALDLDFFQAAMAALAGIPVENAAALVFDRGPDGFKSLYRQSRLPAELFAAFRAAIDVIQEARAAEPPCHNLVVTERILHRLRVEYDAVCPEGLEHTLSQLSRLVGSGSVARTRGLA